MQILLPALPVMQETFAISNDVAQLTLSLSMLAIALGTLLWPVVRQIWAQAGHAAGPLYNLPGFNSLSIRGHYRVADPRPLRSSLWGSGRHGVGPRYSEGHL